MDYFKYANRKLLVSVFDENEVREAIRGGGRIIDFEDPRTALGCISPLSVSRLSRSVLNYKKDGLLQMSTNIGEEQYFYDVMENGIAKLKSEYEIKSKAAQCALGVAAAMDYKVHASNIIKVGVDRMPRHLIKSVLSEIVQTVEAQPLSNASTVMAVFFIQDIDEWNKRKSNPHVISELISLRKYSPSNTSEEGSFDLRDYAHSCLKDWAGNLIFKEDESITLEKLVRVDALPESANTTYVKLDELRPHSDFFPGTSSASTTREILKEMVDVTAESGAHSIMLDNRVQSKVSRICSVSTKNSNEIVDVNEMYGAVNDLKFHGVINLDDLRFFVDYCHSKNIEANLAGSVHSAHAQQLWLLIPELDQMANRDAASCIPKAEWNNAHKIDNRQYRKIQASLVRGIVPPEQGGILNIRSTVLDSSTSHNLIKDLIDNINDLRSRFSLPTTNGYLVDQFGCIIEAR